MGVYGSPDLSKKRITSNEYKEKGLKRNHKILLIILLIINVLIILLVGLTKENISTLIALDCIICFIYSIINLVYNIITKKSVSNNVKTIIVSFVLFIISITYLGNEVNKNKLITSNGIRNDDHQIQNINDEDIINEIGTRKNPAETGDIILTNATNMLGLNCKLEIELLEVVSNEEAFKMANNSYEFVEIKDNQEYLFAKFRVKNVRDNSDKDIPFNFNWTNFSYATGNYKRYSYTMGLMSGGELLEAVDLYEGAEDEGWICFYIEKDDKQPKAVFLEDVWFDLAPISDEN